MWRKSRFKGIYRGLTGVLTFSLFLQGTSSLFLYMALLLPLPVSAAEVAIDTSVSTSANSANMIGSRTVFISDTTGYVFYRDGDGRCVYSKTTDQGNSWGSAVIFDNQTDCLKVSVWYDRWTPGDDTGTFIHLGTMDSSQDDLFYNRLDTSTDSLLVSTSVSASVNLSRTPTLANTTNSVSIAKATNGEIFMTVSDASDSFVTSCTSSCDLTTSWSEPGAAPLDTSNDESLLIPLSNGDMMLINRDVSANDIRSSIWDGSSWSGWDIIDGSAIENTTFDGGLTAVVNKNSGDVLLAYAADHNDFVTADHDIRTAIYDGTGWTTRTDVLTNVTGRGVHDVTLAVDENTDDVYIAYAIRDTIGTDSTGNVYYKVSTDNMSTWGSEQGPASATAGNIYSPSLNLFDNERLYVSWYNQTTQVLYGETIANIGPDVLVSAIGNAITEVRAGNTDVFMGGAFAIESLTSRSVSAITISENGTIDGQADIRDIAIYYELDTSVPYNCVSEDFSGSESQFGATDTNGFSGPNGTAAFSGTIVGVSPTATMCVYVLLTVESSAADGATIDIEITNPPVDVSVSGATPFPATPVNITGSTTVVSTNLTLDHFHWRNDDGSESGATSATAGVEDTELSFLARNNPRRIRLGISNQGSTSTLSTDFTLEYATAAPTCADASAWTDVGLVGGAWDMFDSANLTDGTDTTDIATSSGGVSNGNTTFISPNGGVRDASSTAPNIIIDTNEFVELEYSVEAIAGAVAGETYCFRVTANSNPLSSYTVYPSATIAADATVSHFGSQISQTDVPSTAYLGGGFSVIENGAGRTITSVTITESGTVNAATGLDNVTLFYDLDTTAPYDCASESYANGATQFGTPTTFSGPNATATVNGALAISPTSVACFYVVADITETAQNGETILISIASPTSDVTVSTGSVGPSTPQAITGTTTLRGGVLTQTHYHWRNDNGSEATATSFTAGSEDTPVANFGIDTPIRLRLGISNEGATTSVPTAYQLQFGIKITTCSAINVWTDIDGVGGDDWDMSTSTNLIDGADTTDVTVANGGVTDENTFFQGTNGGVRDISGITSSSTLTESQFTALEYSIRTTVNTPNETDYCFRVVGNGVDLQQYDQYAEINTIARRDFRIQRGTAEISGLTSTLTAGVDYTAPASTSTAFVRITNTHNTGAGTNSGGGSQRTDEITAYISDQSDITNSFTLTRGDANIDTYVNWEIIEFIGQPGTDNEIVVRDVGSVSLASTDLTESASAVSGVIDHDDVVVFVTGNKSENTTRNLYSTQFTSAWASSTNQPSFTRGATSNAVADVSYAVVEFVGANWAVQRVEHEYTAAGVTETQAINPVNSLERTFLHTQKRTGATADVVHFGHTVLLSSIGAISFELEAGASVLVEQTSVAWVIENTQVGQGAMNVQRINGATTGGVEPLELSLSIPVQVDALNNVSVYGNSRAAGANTAHPRAIAGLLLTDVDTVQLWRSDTGANLTYRIEVVEWPVANLALRQNYYRFYVDNNGLTPTDPWPAGPTDLGENTAISEPNDALGDGEVVRARISLRVSNANLSAGLQTFNLQYGERVTTCSAVTNWFDLGDTASSSAWRGFVATGTTDGTAVSANPPLSGELLLAVSDVGGSLEQENPSVANPYPATEGDDVEFDWYIQQNGATPSTVYCFRMVRPDVQLDGYFNYPTIRTAGFSPATQDWRWYSDTLNETPSAPLAATNTAPSNIQNEEAITLRITIDETKNVISNDTKFRLQFSEYPDFRTVRDVTSTSSCDATSLWCYAPGPVPDNTRITTSVLNDNDGCVTGTGNGCGSHNSNPIFVTGHTHGAGRAQEYSFTLRSSAPRVNATYYFRLLDTATALPVVLASGETYPSLVTESSTLDFTLTGLPSGTTTAGVTTDIGTTPTDIAFGTLPIGDDQIAAQRLNVSTNATEGFQVFKFASSQLIDSYGNEISPLAASNTLPGSWSATCDPLLASCFGYHTTDATLSGDSTRFAAVDTYAGIHTDLEEIMFSSIATSSTEDIVYRVVVTELQPAGIYETDIVYVVVPIF